MTLFYLLAGIVGTVLLQLGGFLGLGLWRDWRAYRALNAGTPEPGSKLNTIPAWPGYRTFRLVRKVPEDALAQICSFYWVPEDGQPLLPYAPGQFLTFSLEVPAPSGGTQALVRCYSLSDAPQPGQYRISVKRATAAPGSEGAPGRVSNYLHDQVAVGCRVQVRAPAGHFHLDPSDGPVVLIGGGIGITPLLSMLMGCRATQPDREVWLFYGARNRSELMMLNDLVALAAQQANIHLHLCLSDPVQPETQPQTVGPAHFHHGRVSVPLLRECLPSHAFHFYLCGPTPMLESLVPALEDWGVPGEHIHFEAFGPASIPRKRVGAAAQGEPSACVAVTFSRSGKDLLWSPDQGSLLDMAEAQGVGLSSGCRTGACGSCQTRVLGGEVSYLQPHAFEAEPGTCLLCVCTPKSALTLEA